MKTDTTLIIGSTIFIICFGLFSSYLLARTDLEHESFAGSWACTTDLRECPDGSTVGRTPPYCQFASCSR